MQRDGWTPLGRFHTQGGAACKLGKREESIMRGIGLGGSVVYCMISP